MEERRRTFGPSALATPANVLTIVRLLLTPVFLIAIAEIGVSWSAFAIGFVLASTDGIDGWMARKQGTTRSGAFLDPLADKFLVLGGLIALAAKGRFWWFPVGVIAVREVAISLYRSVLGRHGISVPARWWAKVKTVVQELAIGAALIPPLENIEWPADLLLYAGAVLAVVTGVQYVLDGRRAL
jgi:CDP-diacylglycerol---glycerol-3-phosphate 3-phosphatidyltransferase